MIYVTKEQVRLILQGIAEITGQGRSAADLGDTQIEEAINNAEHEVHLYLRKRYDVPFVQPYPESVVKITQDIAVYMADLTFRMSREFRSTLDPIRVRYERAMKLLEGLRSGRFSLEVADKLVENASEVFNPPDVDLDDPQWIWGEAIYG